MTNKSIILTIVLILSISLNAFSFEENPLSDVHKYKQFGLVWGLMKYHHSEVSKGKYNWDEVFVRNVEKIENVKSQEALNVFLLEFILSIKASKNKSSTDAQKLFKDNYDYDWIEIYESDIDLYEKLKGLRDNTNIRDYYVSFGTLNNIPSFDNEKGFNGFDFKNKKHRLLTLFSFWNVIQYNYVNKYLLDVPWFDQLEVFIEDFAKSQSELEYEMLKSKLIASIQDSHSGFSSQIAYNALLKYKPVFGVSLVSDTLVVAAIFNKTLCEKDDIQLGDQIVEIRGMPIQTYLQKIKGPHFAASNNSYLKIRARWILFDAKDTITIKTKRAAKLQTKQIQLYSSIVKKDYAALKPSSSIKEKWKLIDKKIGYINLDSINKKELKDAFDNLEDTDGIIIDLRNYPKFIRGQDLASHLYPKKKTYLKVLMPLKNRPSIGVFNDMPLSIAGKPFTIGNKNSNYYHKRIVLLVNRTTISKAEFIGMAIQASPNCITLGEQTAGAVMNIAVFTLPDQTPIRFTTMGAFYPDGTEVQREGLKIDYKVKETTANFLEDQYIIQGVALIKSKEVKDH